MEITWMIYKQSMKGNILRLKSISKRHRRKNSKLVLASQFVDSKMSDVKFFYSKFFCLKLSASTHSNSQCAHQNISNISEE